jgi:peroxiredoxin
MSLPDTLAAIAASGLPLQGKLDVLKTEFETKLAPPAIVATLHRATDELVAAHAADKALKAGGRAPAFILPDTNGKPVSSKELLARGPLIISFYRGVWCPYCNFDLQALEAARPDLEARGASLVALSPQTSANSRRSQRENSLGFPILSDAGGEVSAQHKQLGADLTQFNGEDSWTLPMPARYVIGQDGVIAYAEVNPDYTHRPEPSDAFPVLDALRARRGA